MSSPYLESLRKLHASTLRLLAHAAEGDMAQVDAEAPNQKSLFEAHSRTTADTLLPAELDEARRLHREIIAAIESAQSLHRDIGQLLDQFSA